MNKYLVTTKLNELLTIFINDLSNNNINYAIVGNYNTLPDSTENDVDIWVSNTSRAQFILDSCAKQLSLKIYMRNVTANGSNNYYFHEQDGAVKIIKMDLMKETAYKSIFPIANKTVYKNCINKWHGFNVASDALEAVVHLIYPLVTFKTVKDKYKDQIEQYSGDTKFNLLLEQSVGPKMAIILKSAIAKSNWNELEGMANLARKHLILNALKYSKIDLLANLTGSIISAFKRIIKRNGCVVAFTGIDGAGKSTMDKYMSDSSGTFFPKGKFRHFYWRPFFLPKLSDALKVKTADSKFDTSGRRIVRTGLISKIKDLVKYTYYATDFCLGYARYMTVAHTGGLVVFDRYHFDNIIYPERFGFHVSKPLMRLVDRAIIPQPDVLFYFYADTHVLFERKKEIDIDVINQQKAVYDEEIATNGKIIRIDTNNTLENSFDEVIKAILRKMSQRYN